MPSLIDDIEKLGKAVELKKISLDKAAESLSNDYHGFTLVGARDILQRWSTAREEYEREFVRAENGLKKAK